MCLFIAILQITPAHDPNDFKVGERHNLEFINIFTDDGNINEMGGSQFAGMPRFVARTAVIDALKDKVLLDDLFLLLFIINSISCSREIQYGLLEIVFV